MKALLDAASVSFGSGTISLHDAAGLLNTLRRRELDEAAARLSAEIGLAHRPSAEGEHVLGVSIASALRSPPVGSR